MHKEYMKFIFGSKKAKIIDSTTLNPKLFNLRSTGFQKIVKSPKYYFETE